MKQGNTPFDETKDVRYAITPGIYPAHVIKFAEKPLKNNTLYVYNLTFRIAEAATGIPITLMKQAEGDRHLEPIVDGNQKPIEGTADVLIGREVRDNGTFFQPNVADGEGWKNNTYRDLCKKLNVPIPVEDDIEYLGRLEEEDVIAQPCKVKIDVRTYDKDGAKMYAVGVSEVFAWEGGEMLSDEILDSLIGENENPGTDSPGF